MGREALPLTEHEDLCTLMSLTNVPLQCWRQMWTPLLPAGKDPEVGQGSVESGSGPAQTGQESPG